MNKYLLLALLYIQWGCAQKNNIVKDMKITTTSFEEELIKRIPVYDKQPAYYLRLRQHNCIYEILVNDYLVEKNYGMGKLASGISINHAILKSGTQTLTYRMYPLGDLMGGEKPIDILLDNSSMSIKLIRVADMKTYDMSKEEVVLEHRSATKDGKFVGAGLPYYEFTYEFEAKVPYENEGWSQGIRLDTLGDGLMERYVKKWYDDYKKLYTQNKHDEILNYNFQNELRLVVSEYKTKKDIIGLKDAYLEHTQYEYFEFPSSYKGTKITYYGKGRIVCLKFPVLETKDKFFRGESGFYYLYDNNESGSFFNIYLYAPKDKQQDGLYLEMIK